MRSEVPAEERRWEWEGARHCRPLKDFGFSLSEGEASH